jgi:16S rRNA processing protein RimM
MKALPLVHSFFSLTPDVEIIVRLPEGRTEKRKMTNLRKMGESAVISLHGISDPETARKYRGAILHTETKLLPQLQENEYLYDQIIGLSVRTEDGDTIGKVSGIFETGSNDVYVVASAGREYLIPAIRDVIREINLKAGTITIQVIDGLLD